MPPLHVGRSEARLRLRARMPGPRCQSTHVAHSLRPAPNAGQSAPWREPPRPLPGRRRVLWGGGRGPLTFLRDVRFVLQVGVRVGRRRRSTHARRTPGRGHGAPTPRRRRISRRRRARGRCVENEYRHGRQHARHCHWHYSYTRRWCKPAPHFTAGIGLVASLLASHFSLLRAAAAQTGKGALVWPPALHWFAFPLIAFRKKTGLLAARTALKKTAFQAATFKKLW